MGLPTELRFEIYKRALPSLMIDHEIRVQSYEAKGNITQNRFNFRRPITEVWPMHLKAAIVRATWEPSCATYAALLSSSEKICREIFALRPNFDFVIELNDLDSPTAIKEILAYDALNNTARRMNSKPYAIWNFCSKVRFEMRYDSPIPRWASLWEQWNIFRFTLIIYQFPEIPFELVHRKPENTAGESEASISFDPGRVTLRPQTTVDDLFVAIKQGARGLGMPDASDSECQKITVVRTNHSVRVFNTPGKTPTRDRVIYSGSEAWMKRAMVLCGKVPLGI